MPYLVFPPGCPDPYVLDDQDTCFLRYFDNWGWKWEAKPANDTTVLSLSDSRVSNKRSLYEIWRKGVLRRQQVEEGRTAAVRKLVATRAQVKARAEGKQRVTRFTWSRKKGKEEHKTRYINHLEDLQSKWGEEGG